MYVYFRYISPGWELLENDDKERITFLNIWHGKCPHISVCFRRAKYELEHSSEPCVAIEMSLRLITFQDELQEAAEKIFIQVFEDNITPVNDNELKCERMHLEDVHIHIHNNFGPSGSDGALASTPLKHKSSDTSNDSDNNDRGVHVVVNNAPTYNAVQSAAAENISRMAEGFPKSLLPHEIRKKLILLLDPSRSPIGSDWRDFASALGKDCMICYLQSTSSPTAHLLDVVESRNMQLSELCEIFTTIERKDCANVIKDYMDSENQPTRGFRRASENAIAEGDDTSVKISNRLQSEESSWTDCSYRGNFYENNSAQLASMNMFDETCNKVVNSDNLQPIYKPNIPSMH